MVMSTLFFLSIILLVPLAFYNFKKYQKVRDENVAIKWYDHACSIGISLFASFMNVYMLVAVVLNAETLFTLGEFRLVIGGMFFLLVGLFVVLLFYISCLDEKRLHKKTKTSKEALAQ